MKLTGACATPYSGRVSPNAGGVPFRSSSFYKKLSDAKHVKTSFGDDNMANGGRHTSLQRLQSLEKDFKDLPGKLKGLCDILRKPTLVGLDPTKASSSTRTADGRVDWALRWLLSKLKASDTAGVEYVTRMHLAGLADRLSEHVDLQKHGRY